MQYQKIETSKMTRVNNPPQPINSDSYGNKWIDGMSVIFNHSGCVRCGTLINIDRNRWVVARAFPDKEIWWWNTDFSAKVLCDDGHISTIKNPNSIIGIPQKQ